MQRTGLRASRAVGPALGALIFEAIRRRLRADTWDYGRAEVALGDRVNRTVVPVTFGPGEFRAVATSAAAAGVGTAQFIREAALARARE